MYACDFRASAWNSLSGKWGLAVLAGLLAGLLGGASFEGGPEFKFSYNTTTGLQAGFGTAIPNGTLGMLAVGGTIILVMAIVMGVIYTTIGSVVELGYARFNLDLIDGQTPELGGLFGYFSWFKTAFCARFLTGVYTFLWSLLLVIPGIIASYSYAMVPYILAENPELRAGEAIQQSKELMSGNRWRLFCLHFSFIGWYLLCVVTLGIASLWVTPYINAAEAAFYRDITANPQPSGADDPFFQNPEF